MFWIIVILGLLALKFRTIRVAAWNIRADHEMKDDPEKWERLVTNELKGATDGKKKGR